jgi:hypothetical protein
MATARPSACARERVTNPHVGALKSHADPRSVPAVSQDRPALTRLRWAGLPRTKAGPVFLLQTDDPLEGVLFLYKWSFPSVTQPGEELVEKIHRQQKERGQEQESYPGSPLSRPQYPKARNAIDERAPKDEAGTQQYSGVKVVRRRLQ